MTLKIIESDLAGHCDPDGQLSTVEGAQSRIVDGVVITTFPSALTPSLLEALKKVSFAPVGHSHKKSQVPTPARPK